MPMLEPVCQSLEAIHILHSELFAVTLCLLNQPLASDTLRRPSGVAPLVAWIASGFGPSLLGVSRWILG